MKKYLIFALLILSGCSKSFPIQPEISRSQIFYGQTVAELQDNFGVPSKAERFAYDVIVYTFDNQDIVAGRVDKIVKNCNLRVFVQNDRVMDWEWSGNNCQFKVKKTQSLLLDDFYEGFNTPNQTKEYEDMFD
jgi:outer membrane protein assembly factor BamE (lipoprotein component of BamABCDE complex)